MENIKEKKKIRKERENCFFLLSPLAKTAMMNATKIYNCAK